MTTTQFNQYIIDFLQTNAKDMADELIEAWNDKNNQKKFNKITKKACKKPKKAKDPLKPKQAKSAYMFFCSEERKNITDMKAKEVLVELGKRWKEFKLDQENEQELEKYNKLAEKDKTRFQEEMECYKSKIESDTEISNKSETDDTDTDTEKKQNEERETEKPKSTIKEIKNKKRPAFWYFQQEMRKEFKNQNPELKYNDITKLMRNVWKNMTKEDKHKYENMME